MVLNMVINNPTPNVPWWATMAKAIVAAILGFALAFLSALLPFLQEGHNVTMLGWVTATIAGLASLAITGGVVYTVPNAVKK